MIKKFKVQGFKSINDLSIEMKKFNLFTGTNSSGKSSIIQAILLLSQNLDNEYGLNGPLVSVGNYRDAKNYNVNLESIKIEAEDDESLIGVEFKEEKIREIHLNNS